MKRLLLLSLTFVLGLPIFAQLNGDGFYRVQNVVTERFIKIVDNRGSINISTTEADLAAIMTKRPFSSIVDDPGTVIYIQKVGDNYRLYGQGVDTYTLTGYNLSIKESGGVYYAYASKNGMTKYLNDTYSSKDTGYLLTNSPDTRTWYIKPINHTDGQYFGLRPEVSVGGTHYATMYASFAVSLPAGMKAYYINKVDNDFAILKEISGVVPPATPVLLKLVSAEPSDNMLDPKFSGGTVPTDNKLGGVYFCNDVEGNHRNVTANDPTTMRVLGVTADGKLGFVKSDAPYATANKAYLNVPSTASNELRVVTEAEYEAIIAERENDNVTLTAKSYTRVYGDPNPTFEYTVSGTGTLKGQPAITCEATATSPVGTYPIVISKGTVSNYKQTYVNGTLTITQAPLTISAGTYTKKQGEAMPEFKVSYSGFKNGETAAVLTKQPIVKCDATAASAPGEYPITVSGAEAQNYAISYVVGKLIVTEADPVTVKAKSYSREYGDENPTFEYEVEGAALDGTPEISCEATATSPVGTYPIVIKKGSVKNYNDTYVNGVLTITQAPLTISAGTYTKKQGEAMPEFKVSYSGFKNGETAAVLTKQPVVNCDATVASAPGEYPITVSGAEAQNYAISYVVGKLIVTEADPVTVKAKSYSREYGDENPTFEYEVEGAALDGTPEISCEATATSPVGTYPIVIKKGSVKNYNDTYVNGVLTITKAPLTVTAQDCSREEGQENPVFELTYTGWKNGEDESVLTVKPVATTEATMESTPGEYDITVSGGEAQNYSFEYVNGKLTVIEASGIATLLMDGKAVNVYSPQGYLVRSKVTNLNDLPAGLYIVNGRKVVIK